MLIKHLIIVLIYYTIQQNKKNIGVILALKFDPNLDG